MSGTEDADAGRRSYLQPYSPKNPIPTISKYTEEKKRRQQEALDSSGSHDASDSLRTPKAIGRGDGGQQNGGAEPQGSSGEVGDDDDDGAPKDTSETAPGDADAKQRRKEMKKSKRERAEREVTDPVTHLPVKIHDFTDENIEELEPNEPPSGSTKRSATGLSNKSKSSEDLDQEKLDMQRGHEALVNLFPPPDFDALRQEIASVNKLGMTVGLAGAFLIVAAGLFFHQFVPFGKSAAGNKGRLSSSWWRVALDLGMAAVGAGAIFALVAGVRDWVGKKVDNIFDDEIWDAQRQQIRDRAEQHETESTAWLNSLLGSVWPLINPDLFTSLADTLEDVMQASLPKLVRMVSVDDIGQGSESLRILGVRWLPTGAAAKSVGEDGKLGDGKDDGEPSDRQVPGEGDVKGGSRDEDGDGQTDDPQTGSEGMEAEEGDFVNLELAFAYRTRSSSKSLKDRTKDMHLYLAFYLPGNIKLPVWVDLRGVVGLMRMRLQLTPDPPFFALCTLTFLGQPKVNLSCVPLARKGLNIMDVPLISNFVQSAVDAAMAQYVAPKSLTLDLKDMLSGDDFKKDTNSRGVIMVNIRRGYDFKMGDTAVPLVSDGSSDPYVTVGWAKFGKPMYSTRIMISEMEPRWDETAFLLVTAEELNVDERLRLQLWDSDRFTADDDLGRIEVDVKSLMRDDRSNGKMWERSDGFKALKAGEDMPGKLEWSVGYFSKTRLQQDQFEKQDYDTEIRNTEQLQKKVTASCERKLRETMFKEGRSERDQSELEQQKAQEMKAEQDAIMVRAPPPEGYPSGIFSIQIHQITGLELEKLSKKQADKDHEASDEEEAGGDLPSAYCTVIINHKKVFKTRTKPSNAKPFYNAGCERFIRDWTDCEVYVSVRDARVHEDDPLLGIVHLPLAQLFRKRSQVNGFWPLAGGIGYGRIRLSMVWRSVQLQAPENLLGWEYGTLQVQPTATSSDCPDDVQSAKLRFTTSIGSGKMYPQKGEQKWATKKDRSLRLAVQKRYNSCLSIAFRHSAMMGDKVVAFSVLWLKDIPDEEEQDLELPIWKGNFERATSCCLEECGERVGTLKLKATFWAGLGGAHSKWASKDPDLKNVVEVLDTARDNLESDKLEREVGIVDEDVDSSSESSSSDDSEDEEAEKPKHGPPGIKDSGPAASGDEGSGSDDDGNDKENIIDKAKDYKKHNKGTHRRHRGVMQWKAPRTAQWMKHKLERVEDGVSGIFERHDRQPGVETEV